jgi:hypothetical protein
MNFVSNAALPANVTSTPKSGDIMDLLRAFDGSDREILSQASRVEPAFSRRVLCGVDA